MRRNRTRGGSLRRAPYALAAHVAATALTGGALLVAMLVRLAGAHTSTLGAAFAVVAVLVVVGELRPLVTAGHTDAEGVTVSTAFVFAVLLRWGLPAALAVQSAATLLAAGLRRTAPWRVAFDVGQHALSWGAAALVLAAAGRDASIAHPLSVSGAQVPVVLAAGAAFFAVNGLLVARAVAVHRGTALRAELFDRFGYQVLTSGALLALAPIVVVTAERGPALVPLLVVPLFAVYATASVSLDSQRRALHDALTGLPNRTLYLQRAREAVAGGGRVAVVLVDLDRFKQVNDTLGHAAGDTLLRLVASRLAGAVRPGDTVARLGGDEFAVLLPALASDDVAVDVARRLRAALLRPLRSDDLSFDIDASLGVAVYPEHGSDLDTLLARADVAMYLAKETRSGVELYAAERAGGRVGVLADLRRALGAGELELHYQPQAELGTGAVERVEALLRWRHPTRGLVLPAEFVPLAEQSGLGRPLAAHVLDVAVGQLAAWWRDGIAVTVAVNVGPAALDDPGFVDALAARLDAAGVPAHALRLEVAEDVLADQAAARTLRAVARLGVGVSLDDVGTGRTSLVALERSPVTELKVDRTFVAGLHPDGDGAGVVRAVVGLASTLGLRVVAEGVETAEAWRSVVDCGCDAAQGWYLAQPMPAEEATAWLRAAYPPEPGPGGARVRPSPVAP